MDGVRRVGRERKSDKLQGQWSPDVDCRVLCLPSSNFYCTRASDLPDCPDSIRWDPVVGTHIYVADVRKLGLRVRYAPQLSVNDFGQDIDENVVLKIAAEV